LNKKIKYRPLHRCLEMENVTSINQAYPASGGGNQNNCSNSVRAEDAGLTYTKRSVMSKRYFVRVFCDDLQVNRIHWDIPVPDTLTYVPPNGWHNIPYGLDSLGEK
jgi:hypothetical protein